MSNFFYRNTGTVDRQYDFDLQNCYTTATARSFLEKRSPFLKFSYTHRKRYRLFNWTFFLVFFNTGFGCQRTGPKVTEQGTEFMFVDGLVFCVLYLSCNWENIVVDFFITFGATGPPWGSSCILPYTYTSFELLAVPWYR